MTTTHQASRAKSKRHFCAASASSYLPPQGETALEPAMPRAPRAGYAWDSAGQEIKLMQGRRRLQRRQDSALVDERASDRHILTGEEDQDE